MPWRDHIICEKFHRSQFGKRKVETINKNTWQWRDPLVFGCYQSIAMHNVRLKMADGVQTDFSHIEKLNKKGKKVNPIERVLIYGALVASLFFAVRPRSVAAAPSSSSSSISSSPSSTNLTVSAKKFDDGYVRNAVGEIVELLPISWQTVGGRARYWLEGVSLTVGTCTSRGVVESVGIEKVLSLPSLINPPQKQPETTPKTTKTKAEDVLFVLMQMLDIKPDAFAEKVENLVLGRGLETRR